MKRPAAILFELAGSPAQQGCSDAPAWCVVCAAHAERTASYDAWAGATFTDQNKLRGHGLSDRICEACVWAHSWTPPPGWVPDAAAVERKREAKRKAGKEIDLSKERPPNLRLFWHAWDERGGYVFGTKGDKATLRAWLLAPKQGAWFCAVSDSGQKHVLPWTPVNATPLGRVVRFEERDVVLGDPELVGVMSAALTAGVTKDEIEAGTYSVRAWTIAEAHVRELLERGRTDHGGGWWALALWLAQRDEGAATARMAAEKEAREAKHGRRAARGRGTRGDDGSAPGAQARVPAKRRRSADALGPALQPAPGRVPDERDGRAAHQRVATRAPAHGAQLGLFGGSGAAGAGDGR